MTRSTTIRFLLFVLVCLTFTTYLATTIGNIDIRDPLGRNTYEVDAMFDDVAGLLPNDNVKVAGVVVGKVTGIKLVDGRAKVSMKLHDSLVIPSDSTASIRWRNLLGQRFVYLYAGTSPTRLQSGAVIDKTRSVVDLGELFNRLGPIVKAIDPDKVNTFLDSVVGALDGNEQSLRGALDDLGKVTTSIASRDDAIKRILDNLATVAKAVSDRDAQIQQVLDNVIAIAGTFGDSTAVIDRAITDLDTVSKSLGSLLAANRTQVDSILANLVPVVQAVQSKLPTVDKIATQLDELAATLYRTSRYGEWLNQVIPCGRVRGPAGDVEPHLCSISRNIDQGGLVGGLGPGITDSLDQTVGGLTGSAGVQSFSTAPGAPTPGTTTAGSTAVSQLLGVVLQPLPTPAKAGR